MTNKILSSYALYKELYDNDKDTYSVISEFIKATITKYNGTSFNIIELHDDIKNMFGIDVPVSILKTALHKYFVKKNIISNNKNIYVVLGSIEGNEQFQRTLEEKSIEHDNIIKNFIAYIQDHSSKQLFEKDVTEIIQDIEAFALDNGYNSKYSAFISAYFIKSQNTKIQDAFNDIKEGFILFGGLSYTSNINEIQSWNNKLIIFLDTEILIGALGYDGELYKSIFDDFFTLVMEINSFNKTKFEKTIELKYLKSTERKIQDLFEVGKEIKKGKRQLIDNNRFMTNLMRMCKNHGDVFEKEKLFFNEIKLKGIILFDETDIEVKAKYNLIDKDIISELVEKNKEYHQDSRKEYVEEDYYNILELFSKINTLRQGSSDHGFENSKYILLTGKYYIQHIAFSNLIKDTKDIPFATNIDFIINRLWFKLAKGFDVSEILPKTFNLITKAKIIISNQLNISASKKYELVQNEVRGGQRSKEEIALLNAEIRSHVLSPEDINENVVENSLLFISSEEDITKYLEVKSNLEIKLRDKEEEKIRLKEHIEESSHKNEEEKSLLRGHIDIKEEVNTQLNIENKKIKQDLLQEKIKYNSRLERDKKNIDDKSRFTYLFFKIRLILYICLYFGIILYETFSSGWNSMELWVTIAITIVPLILGYIYEIIKERKFEIKNYIKNIKTNIYLANYQKHFFDNSEIKILQTEILTLKDELKDI